MSKDKSDQFRLEVPISASQVEGFTPGTEITVLAQHAGGVTSQKVRLDAKGAGVAVFGFKEAPGATTIILGPGDASDSEMLGLQTMTQAVPAQRWKDAKEVKLDPIAISPFYWHFWLTWCRTFTIHGRLLCRDGSAVIGAKICAYDVDWWWWWSSYYQVGCATTDQHGAFTITFRHCCGFWPWWWWERRFWQFEEDLAARIIPRLQGDPAIRKVPIPGPRPDLTLFNDLLPKQSITDLRLFQPPMVAPILAPAVSAAASHIVSPAALATALPVRPTPRPPNRFDPTVLTGLRETLLKHLPADPELERRRIWPWWEWRPWLDCTPDIVFYATQACGSPAKVVLKESIWDTHWDIPTTFNVNLTANDQACCVAIDGGDPTGNCVLITSVCDDHINTIGGNPGAPPPPPLLPGQTHPPTDGFQNPGVGDRPYAELVRIQGQIGDGVDYYEFEWSADYGAHWHTMPAAAVDDIPRTYWIPASDTFTPVPVLGTVDGRLVYETRHHYEANNAPGTWNVSRFWISDEDYISLMLWATSLTLFADGPYMLRVRGWKLQGGHLVDLGYLPTCSTRAEDHLLVTLDNRVVGTGSGHPASTPGHPCGTGTVHLCTMEPDTQISAVRIIHADMSSTGLGACGNTSVTATDKLQIDFWVYDQSDHLDYYTLHANWDVNLTVDLLALDGATLTTWTPPAGGPPAALQVGPTYADARSSQGAIPPVWAGGGIRLEVPLTGPTTHLRQLFPETCCYQLELRGYKRSIVSCYHGDAYGNVTEYGFTIQA